MYTGDPCKGVRSLPQQTKNKRYGPESLNRKSKGNEKRATQVTE